MTDKEGIGRLRLVGSYDLHFYQPEQIKRVRFVKRADGYYCQFLVSDEIKIQSEPTNKTIGLDVGLSAFYTDDQGNKIDNPQFLRKGEKTIKRLQRQVSRQQKGSSNRKEKP